MADTAATGRVPQDSDLDLELWSSSLHEDPGVASSLGDDRITPLRCNLWLDFRNVLLMAGGENRARSDVGAGGTRAAFANWNRG